MEHRAALAGKRARPDEIARVVGAISIHEAARRLEGDVVRGQVVFRAPGHSRADRSACVRFDPRAPEGFIVHSFAVDDPLALRDTVRDRLGLPGWQKGQQQKPPVDLTASSSAKAEDNAKRTADALALWAETEPDHPLLHEYLGARGIELPPRALGETVRFRPHCPWGGGRSVPAMVCLVRELRGTTAEPSGAPKAVHRTRLLDNDGKLLLRGEGRKKAFGPTGGGVIKLSPDEDAALCLGVAEGVETALSLRNRPEFGQSPVWSLIDAGNLQKLPVLSGVETLWVAVDNDRSGRGQKAAGITADRWEEAGREVFLIKRTAPDSDLNDLDIRGGQQ